MITGALRIAGNDPTLAHAASRAGIVALADRSAALYERLYRKSVKEIARILRQHYGALLLIEEIGRAGGSRAHATWIVLDGGPAGEDLVPSAHHASICRGYGELTVSNFSLRLTAHAVARILQRTLHHAEIRSAGPMLLHHVAQASALIEGDTLRRGDRVHTASPEGVLLWEARRVDGV